MTELNREIVRPLLAWYSENARPLPWRLQPDPYRVWVSEIMLQQTRVEAVKPYYERFLREFPDVCAFAQAPEDRWLKLWEGLGYYSRVRNMHKCAVEVMEKYGGEFPADRKALLSLPGIGSYTSGAIASIAFGIPAPAVDGNVLRVVTRLSADGRNIMDPRVRASIEKAVERVVPADAPGEFNQSLIELGATVCVPNGVPRCESCPVRAFCCAAAEGTALSYPVKAKKSPRRMEEKTVLLITDGERVLLSRRPDTGLLAGLYEFVNLEGYAEEETVREELERLGLAPINLCPLPDAKHIFTHVEWHMKGFLARVSSLKTVSPPLIVAEIGELRETYALPSAFGAYRRLISGMEA